jgi:hypothetical protein
MSRLAPLYGVSVVEDGLPIALPHPVADGATAQVIAAGPSVAVTADTRDKITHNGSAGNTFVTVPAGGALAFFYVVKLSTWFVTSAS